MRDVSGFAETLTEYIGELQGSDKGTIVRMLEEAEERSETPYFATFLGKLWEEGLSGDSDTKKALEWYEKARQKLLPLKPERDMDLPDGDFPDDDWRDASGLDEESRDMDLIVSAGLARCYAALGDRAGYFAVLLHIARDCRDNDYETSIEIALHYRNADGVERDLDQARRWYATADDFGSTSYAEEVAESIYYEIEDLKGDLKAELKSACRQLAETLKGNTLSGKTDQAALSLAKVIVSGGDVQKAFERFRECFLAEDGEESCSSEYLEIRSGSFLRGLMTFPSLVGYRGDKLLESIEAEADRRKTPYAACLAANLLESYPNTNEKKAREWYRRAEEKLRACLEEPGISTETRRQYEELSREIEAGLERCEKTLGF